jgi:hypothetical protein
MRGEELRNLYSSSNIVREIKSRRMRWDGVDRACSIHGVGEWEISVKSEGKRPLGRHSRSCQCVQSRVGWEYFGCGVHLEVKIKVKLPLRLSITEHHPMKAYWGSGGIAPRILDLGTRWRWVVSLTPRPHYPQGKSPWYPLDRRLGGRENFPAPPGIDP